MKNKKLLLLKIELPQKYFIPLYFQRISAYRVVTVYDEKSFMLKDLWYRNEKHPDFIVINREVYHFEKL